MNSCWQIGTISIESKLKSFDFAFCSQAASRSQKVWHVSRHPLARRIAPGTSPARVDGADLHPNHLAARQAFDLKHALLAGRVQRPGRARRAGIAGGVAQFVVFDHIWQAVALAGEFARLVAIGQLQALRLGTS